MNHLGDTNKMVGEDHIRDATKMVSDTPRTDAAEYESQDEPVAKLGAVDADFARQLERELNAANERIKRLEEAGDKMFWTLDAEETGSVGKEMWRKAKEAKP